MLILLSLFWACVAPPTADCAGSEVTGTVHSGPTDEILRSQDLVVTGSAQSAGLAIRTLTVGPEPATPDETNNNFATWSVTLPITTLVSLVEDESNGVGTVSLDAVATDSCGQTWPIGDPITLQVDTSPDILVSDLDLSVAIPSGLNYLPVNGSISAVLSVSANADAAGAEVDLSSTLGSFAPADSVVLAGDGSADAQANVLVYADSASEAGDALITASAEGQLATTALRFAGAPWFSPESLSLEPGDRATVLVQSEGGIHSCSAWAETTADVAVSSGGQSLYGVSVSDEDEDGLLQITVSASPNATEDSEVLLRCCDLYGQCTDEETGLILLTAE